MTVGLVATALEEMGLLDPSEVAAAQVEDLSRAHPVSRVLLPDGRRWVVKRSHQAGGIDLAVECLVYRMAAWCEPVAAALPRPVAVDEDRRVLVLTDVGAAGAGSLAEQVGLPPILYGRPTAPQLESPAVTRIAGLLGATVGRLHRATAGFPLPPAPLPVVLVALGPARMALGGAMDTAVSALTSAEPGLAAVATEMAGPVAGCLVNHDLKWDNIVLTDDRAVLLDWETAGLGDPAWDLGCLLAEHQLRHPDANRIDAAGAALLGHYAEAVQLKASVRPAFARRVWLAVTLCTAQLAIEVANFPARSAPGAVEALSALAHRQLAATTDQTQEIRRCLS